MLPEPWATGGLGAAHRRSVRGVPVHVERADRLGGRRAQPGPAARAGCGRRVRGFRLGAVLAVAVPVAAVASDPAHEPGRHRRARVRGGRLDVLPAARPRHLVARADQASAPSPGSLVGGGLWPSAAVPSTIVARLQPRAASARCSPSPRPGRCRPRSPSWSGSSLDTRSLVPPGAARPWSGCTPPSASWTWGRRPTALTVRPLSAANTRQDAALPPCRHSSPAKLTYHGRPDARSRQADP